MQKKSGMNNRKKILWYLGGVMFLIALGLLSRRLSVIPASIGDALWAMTVYCCWRIVLIRKRPAASALAAIIASFAIELSQLLTMEWLVRLRMTFIGHMLLGQGFLWTDLVAYTIGIAIIFIVTAVIEDKEAAHRKVAGFLSELAAAGNGKDRMTEYKIAVLSDTHDLLRPEVLKAIRGCEMIFHAGDIGSRKILDRIAEIAPVSAVRGNADQNIDLDLPEQLIVNIHGVRVFMTHKKKDVPQELCGTDLVIFGHSHRYEVSELNGVCYLNPGSCGPRRFHQPITMALLRISEDGAFTIEKLDIPHQEGVRKSEAQDEALLREDPGKLVKRVVSEVNRGKSVQQIAVKLHISEELAETISRMYLTHPGVTTEGILQRIGL